MESYKILIIEEDEKIQFAFQEMLKREGYEGIKAITGSSAVKLVKSSQYRAIFLALELPDMDGMKILKLIRQIDKTVPVVVFSCMVTSQKVEQSIELGAIEVLEKPLSLANIREILHKIKLYDH